jgi:putative heme transporter
MKKIAGRIAFLVIAGFGLYVVWPSLLTVFSAWPQLKDLSPGWFLTMLALELGSFACAWALIRRALHAKVWFRIATSQLAGNAISRIVPGGAAAGGALQFQMLTTAGGIDGARVATGLTAASLISTATLLALPVLAVPAMLSGVPVARQLRTTAFVGFGVFVLMIAVGTMLLTTERPLRFVGRVVDGVRNRLSRGEREGHHLPDQLVGQRDLVREDLGERWWVALLAAAGNWAFDFAALLAALVAVGTKPRPSLVLLAYVVAAVLGMIPITPGGLGFVEAGLTATLVLAGVSASDAAFATLAYRLVSYWLPLPAGLIGYALYRRRYGGRVGDTSRGSA